MCIDVQQTNSKAMDENQSRDHRSNSHHENGAPSLSSYEPTGHASTMHTDSQMKNSAVRSDSQHSRHVSMHQATGYGHSHTHSSGSVSTLQQDSQTTGACPPRCRERLHIVLAEVDLSAVPRNQVSVRVSSCFFMYASRSMVLL